MSLRLVLIAVLALAVVFAWFRLMRWQIGSPPEARSPAWRLALLIVAQPLAAVLLYLTLAPPPVRTAVGTLVVVTRGASARPAFSGDLVVSLPEAPALASAERVPDLGTALRRYPGTDRIRIVGEGLPPRDLDAARGLRVDFEPGSATRGIVHLAPPAPHAPGSVFPVSGRVAGHDGGSVELLDPAGIRVDRQPLRRGGSFALRGTTRAPGTALFELRVRAPNDRIVERANVPVVAVDAPAPRLLLLAGAPGPETKFLRRWATDAGIDLHVQLAVGGGLEVGDTPIALGRSTLDRVDLAILDERAWAGLGSGERAALIDATRSGLGLLLRVTGPVSEATSRQWRKLGFAVTGGGEVATMPLSTTSAENEMALTRRVVRVAAPDAADLPNPTVGAIAPWRAHGQGRVALWPLTDTYALSLSGRPADHAELWSETVATLARARPAGVPRIDTLPRAGERLALCGLPADASIEAPDGDRTRLVIEPPAACAAYWPERAGWHRVQPAAAPFYVQPATALPGVRATEARGATLQLASEPGRAMADRPNEQPGASWPWFIAWLAVSAGIWGLERARSGAGA
jgi:hypothetical protein